MNPLTILIIIVIIVLVFMFIRYLIVDPYTLQSIQSGKDASTISASSLAKNGSSDSSNFAYSVWFYVNDWNYNYGKPKIILGRMDKENSENKGKISAIAGVTGTYPCPAIILDSVENNVLVSLTCYGGTDPIIQTCMVSNIPIQKWVNLVTSVYGRSMDMYVDGKLVRTCLLPGTAKVNSDLDIQVTPNGGFDGWTSKIQYYPYSINPQEAWNIYSAGYSNGLSMFSTYQVKIAIKENGNEKSSITF